MAGEDDIFVGAVLNDPADLNDFDPDGDTLRVAAVNGSPANVGQAILLPGGGLFTFNANGTYSFNPNSSYDALNEGDRGGETVS